MEKVAIIGMGTSGMAVAAAYAKEVAPGTVQVDCYDSEESFGRGFPYRDDSEEIILNLKTGKISYDYQDNHDLTNWLKENELPINEYTSRNIFGLYTRDRLKSTMADINANKIIEKVSKLNWLEKDKKWELETIEGNIKIYDRVHLCCGELPQKDPFKLEGYERYIWSVYPCQIKLEPIQIKDTVSIIGAGLTAVDVATYLLEKKQIHKLYMFSRTNLIPTVRVDPVELEVKVMTYDKCLAIIKAGNGFISFQQFEELFNQELEIQGIDYDSFIKTHMSGGIEGLKINIEEPEVLAKVQALLPLMNLTLNQIWLAFTLNDRHLFRKKYHSFMCLNRSPLPLHSAKILIEAEKAGRLTMLDNISDIKSIDGGKSFQLLTNLDSSSNLNHGTRSIVAQSNWICNATGLDTSLETTDRHSSLIGDLLNKYYLQVDNYGGVTVLPGDISAISPRFGELSTLHVHGVLISGVQYRNNSTLIIQKTAHDLIKKLY